MNILIVDDEEVQIENLKIGLRTKGHNVISAVSVQEALERLPHSDIDMVLTDYLMPGKNGIDLLKTIREDHVSLPVVMMTAYGEKDLVIEALHNQCDGFIEKPFTVEQLLEIIDTRVSSNNQKSKFAKMGELIYATSIGQELRRSYDMQRVISSILGLSLEDIPLDELLNRAIDFILSLPWLSPQAMGGIFVLEDRGDQEVLVMKTKHTFPEAVQKLCKYTPLGRCHCGRAASTRRLQFFSSVSELHEVRYEGMPPHGAYCIPILFLDNLLGVLNIYVEDGHGYDPREKKFLVSLANTLAGVIKRRKDQEEKEELQAQLLQAQKMEAMGTLAAGIAHEINTPIQYIGDNMRFLQEAFDDFSALINEYGEFMSEIEAIEAARERIIKIKELEEEIDLEYVTDEIPKAIEQGLEGVGRVAKIVRAMKEFSHPGSEEKTLIDINRAIENTVTIARNEWKYVANMVTDLDPQLPTVPCFPGEFNQVILNIIINAAHAIADIVEDKTKKKGSITIKTRRNGQWCDISIKDTGGGIPENIRSRIFDPFFTTKDVGKGTGQGLAISHHVIMEKHGGTLHFKSELGKGTIFFIRLPLEDK